MATSNSGDTTLSRMGNWNQSVHLDISIVHTNHPFSVHLIGIEWDKMKTTSWDQLLLFHHHSMQNSSVYTSKCIIVALFLGSPLTPSFITLCQGTVEESGNEASIIMCYLTSSFTCVLPTTQFLWRVHGKAWEVGTRLYRKIHHISWSILHQKSCSPCWALTLTLPVY